MIPVDWEVKKIKDVSNLKSGETITAKKIFSAGEYPCFGGNGLRGYTNNYTHEGHFPLIGRQGALCGNMQYATGKFFASEHAVVVSANDDTNPKLLFYILKKMNLNQYSESSAQPGLSVSRLSKLEIPLPPTLAEQTAIAAALSDMDSLIERLERLIGKKRAVKQGAMQELLTGKRRLAEFGAGKGMQRTEVGVVPEDWEVKPLEEIVNFLDGQRKPIKSADRAKMQGVYPYYGASGIIDYVNDYLFDDELILLGEDGENIISRNLRLAFVVSGKIWVNNHAHVLRTKEGYDTHFVAEKLESMDFEQYNTGTAQPKLNKQTCSKIPLAIPPTLAEQRAVARALSDMDMEIGQWEAQLAKYRRVKEGMMQELLTGKKRLV